MEGIALYVLYSVLMYAVPGGIFWTVDTHYEQRCEAMNAQFVAEGREGPLPECLGLW